VLALRDKYTGHSVNAMSQAVVTGQADNWPEPASIRGLAFRALIQRSLVIDMLLLVATVRDSLADEIEAARLKVLIAHANVTTADLLRLGDVQVLSAPTADFDFVTARRSGQSSGQIRIPLVGDPAAGSEAVATLTIF